MGVRENVRETQRKIAALDSVHSRAVTKLGRAISRRSEVLAEQDGLVASAEAEVGKAVSAMALAIGVELTVTLLELEPAEVRRMAKLASSDDSEDRWRTTASTRFLPSVRTGAPSGGHRGATTP